MQLSSGKRNEQNGLFTHVKIGKRLIRTQQKWLHLQQVAHVMSRILRPYTYNRHRTHRKKSSALYDGEV